MQKKEFTKEQRALHKLIVDSIGMNDIGLFDGKMGIVISLITYSRSNKLKCVEGLVYKEKPEGNKEKPKI